MIPPPPATKVDQVVDLLHGIPVPDPYRWLEDGDSEETKAWVAAENARTRGVLDALPIRTPLLARLNELLRAPTSTAPAVAGHRVFSLDRGGDRDQAQLVARSSSDPNSATEIVIDPVARTGQATAAIDWYRPSLDGALVAYGMSEAGSERSTLAVVETDTGCHLPERIPDTRAASVAWLPDASAFAYTRYPPGAEYGRRVWWHRLGDDPAHDQLLFGSDLDETAWPDVDVSPDGRWLVIHVQRGWTRNDVYLLDRLSGRQLTVVEGEESVTWARVVGDRLYAATNLGSPRGRVVRAPATSPEVGSWHTLVPEGHDVVEGLAVAGPSLLVHSSSGGAARLHRYHLDGRPLGEVNLPELGSLVGLDADPDLEMGFVSFTSFTRPPSLWRWSPEDGFEPWGEQGQRGPLEPSDYVVERVTYPSTDGVEVPLFLVRAATTATAAAATVLTGYGGFAISSSPSFGPGVVAACDVGLVYAVAGIRGGHEHGEAWHRAGMLRNKQQTFDDFAAAADWLVATGRTERGRLAILGRSNGGLLVGATITQRPDLCRAAVCGVPLLDMVRYHRFLLGALWVPEYGNPELAEEFEWLYAYSPYHHVRDGTRYPATLVLTAESDSRVDPLHARKFVARLQAAGEGMSEERPVLLRVEERAGHGAGKPVTKQADELADIWAFLLWQLGVEPFPDAFPA